MVVQMALDEVVDVIAVRDGFVTAARAMLMGAVVAAAVVARRAAGWVFSAYGDRMFDDLAALHMVQMPVVEVVDMVFVMDRAMPASLAVLMIVGLVVLAVMHSALLLSCVLSHQSCSSSS